MEISTADEDTDPPLLVDSGTESYSESPVADVDLEPTENSAPFPCRSEDSTILCDIDSEKREFKKLRFNNLLDKAISVDEDSLETPLQPVKCFLKASSVDSMVPNEENLSLSLVPDEDSLDLNSEKINGNETSNTDLEHFLQEEEVFSSNGDLPQVDHNDQSDLEQDFFIKNQVPTIEMIPDDNDTPIDQEEDMRDHQLSGILRRVSIYDEESISTIHDIRRVSFPSTENALVSYKEPERNHWNIYAQLNAQEILKQYQDSCKNNHSVEIDSLKKQILDIKNNQNRTATLVLANMTITRDVCETLEDLFKITNFKTVAIEECKFKDDTLFELLNMLEYYKTSTELILAMHISDIEMWKFFAEMVTKSVHLESLTCKGLELTEQYTKPLVHAIKHNQNITTLRIEKCKLVFTPTFYLVDMLMQYHGLRELYLTETNLQNKEMETVCRYLTNNSYLQVLDISNNIIGDRGLIQLTTGLMSQKNNGPGLSVLIMVNNSITVKSGPVLGNLILLSKNLHTLNIGYNVLNDQTILDIQESLAATEKLEGLGLQNTLISCIGAEALATAIESNKSLKKINLRGNKGIQVKGLESLSKALTNSKIFKLELDDTNRNCSDQTHYKELVKKINEICAINKSIAEQATEELTSDEISKVISRKVSLSCSPSNISPPPLPVPSETVRKVPSPHPSRTRSSRNRFSVSKVPDTPVKPPASPSRFKVFAVESPSASFSCPSPTQDEPRSFQNVRSSVSSLDSMDSVRTGQSSSVSSIDEVIEASDT